jgi:F-type H+/Na+-transporting ATPase subunit alpha
VNAGISVSRVGGNAQTKAMKKVGGKLRMAMAQYRELAAFAQFGSDLDAGTRAQLTRGERLVEILKQKQYSPMSLSQQVLQLYAGTNGYLDDIPVNLVGDFIEKLVKYAEENAQDIMNEIETVKDINAELETKVKATIATFKEKFVDMEQEANS